MPARVSSITSDHFNEEVLDLYWRFLMERQSIWLRRSRGMDRPWTTDPVLEVEFITNVYRTLDPGTVYVVDSILSHEGSDAAKVFNVMVYRLMGSVPRTHAHLGFLDPHTFNSEVMIAKLRELPDDYRIFGDAYRVATHMGEGGEDKVVNVARVFEWIAGGIDETVRRIQASRSVAEVYDMVTLTKGFGEFLAHQLVVDLLYPAFDGHKILPFTDDEFAKAGPGARKGIWKMLAEGVKPANMSIIMEWLRDNQEAEFNRLALPFPYLATAEGTDPEGYYRRTMSICDIQASLCEFHKYYRIWSGEKRVNVRTYDSDPDHETSLPALAVDMDPMLADSIIHMNTSYTSRGAVEDVDDVERVIDETDVLDEPEQGSEAAVIRPWPQPEHTTLDLAVPDGASSVQVHLTINLNLGRH